MFLRSIGQDEGVVGILPSSFDKLVDLARLELYPDHTGTCRVFSSTGDEYTEKTFDVIEPREVLYFSKGENWKGENPNPPALVTRQSEDRAPIEPLLRTLILRTAEFHAVSKVSMPPPPLALCGWPTADRRPLSRTDRRPHHRQQTADHRPETADHRP